MVLCLCLAVRTGTCPYVHRTRLHVSAAARRGNL